jgi:ribosomal-protein-serine acetyltransferase
MFSGQIEFEPVGGQVQGKAEHSHNPARLQPICHLRYQISDRLELIPLNLTDAPALFALVTSNRTYLKRWLPWLDSNQTLEDSRQYIRQSMECAQTHQSLISGIFYDQGLVGVVGLNSIDWDNRIGGIGYWLDAAHQGKGIMTQACRAVMDYSFTVLHLNRIEIRCATKNSPSEAIAQRLGLSHEGILKDAEWLYDHFVDHHLYAMLQRDWHQQSAAH